MPPFNDSNYIPYSFIITDDGSYMDSTYCKMKTLELENYVNPKITIEPMDTIDDIKERAKICANLFTVKRIHKNGPVTVVIWQDGSKTIVRRSKGTKDDPYTAFCAALAKKMYGSNSQINKMIKLYTKENGKEKK